MVSEARARIEQLEWRRVAELAAALRVRRMDTMAARDLLDLGAQVYEDTPVSLDPLQAVDGVPEPSDPGAGARAIDLLTILTSEDPAWSEFYLSRRVAFERLSRASHDDATPNAAPGETRVEALGALDRADFETVEQVATVALMAEPSASGLGPPLAPVETVAWAAPFGDETVDRARDLGLAQALIEPREDAASDLQCCCVWRAAMSNRPLTERRTPIDGCRCGRACPPAVLGPLKEALDLLIAHPFVTSAGARYLPSYAAETVLVEDFPEPADDDSPARLLTALGLARRVGLSRQEIEQALLEHGPGLVRDALALDPREFRLVCIPFDVYSRVAVERGWGTLEGRWTHFDGYQVWRHGRLRALAGGDLRFGGPYHVFSIGSADDRADTGARFAVVRRARVAARGHG